MAKFRSKPVEIEATQWFKPGDHPAVYRDEAHQNGGFVVDSQQGVVNVNPGDWIIAEPVMADRYYPCSPAVFAAKYEPVT